jgi:hypothetical protein
MGKSWAALTVLCATSGCFSLKTSDDGGDSPAVSIDSLSITPTTVADGESFTASWRVSHNTNGGYITAIALHLGEGSEVESAPTLFSLSVTKGVMDDVSSSSIVCSRKADAVTCGTQSPRTVPLGDTPLTFRACNAFVLDSDAKVCDTQTVMLGFP